MKKILCFALLASLVFTSCQKELGFDTPPDTGSNGGTGTGSTNTECKACIYMPVCNGSWMSNIDTSFVGVTTSTDTLVLVKDTTIDSKIFNKIYSPLQKSYTYYNCTDGATRLIAYNISTLAGNTLARADITILKANLPVGGTWTDKFLNPLGQETVYNSKIVEKGVARTVNGKTFSDVIHVLQQATVTDTVFGFSDTTNSDYYFAKGIGLVESLIVSSTGQVVEHRVITSYYIP